MSARVTSLVLVVFALSACSRGVSMPAPVRGVWGVDCASPLVSFTETSIHLYADNGTYALQAVTFDGNDLNVKYTSPQGPVSETYQKSGETLRLDHGTYAGADMAWNKHAMNRCN